MFIVAYGDQKIVAIKKLNSNNLNKSDDEIKKELEIFKNEIKLLSSCNHQNIIHFYGAVTNSINYYLITDFSINYYVIKFYSTYYFIN